MSTAPGHVWSPPPTDLTLSGDDVHVWRAALDQPEWRIRQLASTLSADERARAARFYFEHDRRHFIVGRGLLRAILGCYLGIEPHRLAFGYGAHGKPALAEPSVGRRLRFNLTQVATS